MFVSLYYAWAAQRPLVRPPARPPDCVVALGRGQKRKCLQFARLAAPMKHRHCTAPADRPSRLGGLDGCIACVQHRERCAFAYARRDDCIFPKLISENVGVMRITLSPFVSFIYCALYDQYRSEADIHSSAAFCINQASLGCNDSNCCK